MNLISIIIPTRNRASDLRRTLLVLRRLNPRPFEILVTADACTDETTQLVTSEFSDVKLFINAKPMGSVTSRDRMIREATGDFILLLDDDSYPEQVDFLAHIPEVFDNYPQRAVVHYPQRSDEYLETLSQIDFGPPRLTRSFANSGAVLRRSIYLNLPGFTAQFFHMYEEPDYAIQCIAAGYDIYFCPLGTIRHHYTGLSRNELKVHHRHSRNEFWSTLLRCPMPLLPFMVIWRVLSQFRYAFSRGISWFIKEPIWWIQALSGIPYCLSNRNPVSWSGYIKWLKLQD